MQPDDVWKFFKDKRGKFRWRRFCAKSKVCIGASTQGYATARDCNANAERNGWINPRKKKNRPHPAKYQLVQA